MPSTHSWAPWEDALLSLAKDEVPQEDLSLSLSLSLTHTHINKNKSVNIKIRRQYENSLSPCNSEDLMAKENLLTYCKANWYKGNSLQNKVSIEHSCKNCQIKFYFTLCTFYGTFGHKQKQTRTHFGVTLRRRKRKQGILRRYK